MSCCWRPGTGWADGSPPTAPTAFRIDRGFQVVNTGYPASSDFVDVTRLDLRFFDHGALVSGRRAAWAVLRELDVAPRPTRNR